MITGQIVRRHAARLAASYDAELREQFVRDPLTVVTDRLGIRVTYQPARELSATGCSVAGSYHPATDTIVLADITYQRRTHFSLLHELGHRLVREDEELEELLWGRGDDADKWTENICDAIAAELLLAPELVDECIGAQGPTADEVATLFERSQASRETCAVRAAQRLTAPGYVTVSGLDATIRFAARAMTPYQIKRGTRQPDGHPLAVAARNGTSRRSDVTLVHASGEPAGPHHSDCVRDGDYVFGVFTTGRPAWPLPGLSILQRPTRETSEYFCDRCQEPYETWGDRCSKCGDRPCPECGSCSCHLPDPSALIRCEGPCGLSWPNHHMVDGLCRDCR